MGLLFCAIFTICCKSTIIAKFRKILKGIGPDYIYKVILLGASCLHL
jgi:hypothetical protein